MPTLGELVVELGADVKGLRKDLAEAQGAVKGYGKNTKSSLKNIGREFDKFGKLAGVALIGVGVAAVKTASQFETSMSNVSTLISGDVGPAIDDLKKGILEMSKTLPMTPNELGASAYDIFSAGITDTSDALNVLNQSAKLSIAGLGSQAAAVDLMTSAINAFGMEAENAEEVANILFTTVKVGKTTVEAMTSQFGNVASQAAAAGVSLADMQAQLAALTAVGVPTSQAQTRLAQAFIQTTKGGTKFATAMEKSGTTMKEFRQQIKEKGFVAALEGVRDSMRKSGETTEDLNIRFKELIESSEAQGVIFSLLGEAGDAYRKGLEEMGAGTRDFNNAVVKQSETLGASIKNLKSAWEGLAISSTGNMDTIKSAIDGLTNLLRGEGQDAAFDFADALEGVFNGIADGAITAFDWAGYLFGIENFGTTVIETLSKIKEAIGGAAESTVDWLGKFADDKSRAQKMQAEAQGATEMAKAVAAGWALAIDSESEYAAEVEAELTKAAAARRKATQEVKEIPKGIDEALGAGAETASKTVDEMTGAIDQSMKTGLDKVKVTTETENKGIADSFKTDLANPVVLESIVPDMIDAIGEQFQRLESEMGDPTKAATDSVVSMFEGMATAFEGFSGAIGTGDISFSDLVGEFVDLGDAVTTLGETAPMLTEQWSTMTSTITTTTTDMTAQTSAAAMDMQSQINNAIQQMVSQSSSAIDRLIQRLRQLQEEFRRTAQEARKMADSVSVKSSLPEMQEKGSPPVKELGEDLQDLTADMKAVEAAGKKMEELAGGAGVTPDLPIPAIDDPRKRNAASQAFNDPKARARATVDMIKNIEAARLDLLGTEERAFEEERIRWAEEQARFEENFALMTKENQVRAEQMGFREDLEAAHLARLAELNTEFRSTDKELWTNYWMEIVENETAWLDVATSSLEEFTQGWTDILAQGIADAAMGVRGSEKTMLAAMAHLVGGIASTWGEFFVLEGLAKLAAGIWPPNPAMLKSGAAEVGAGIALKTLGAVLGGVGKGGGAGASAGAGGAAFTPSTPGIGDFGRGEEDPFQRGEASVVLDIGRLANDPRIATDIAGLTRQVVTELYNQRGMNVEIEVTSN
jgi:TP901 family phage tail tape measure protein